MTTLVETRDDSIVVLDRAAAQIEAVARDLVRTISSSRPARLDSAETVAAARDAWDLLPLELRGPVRRFRRHSGVAGRLVLRGLPIAEHRLGDTPMVAGSVQREASVPAALLLMVAAGLGDPVAYLPEKSGALVQDVVPVPGQEAVQGNTGSIMLSFHIENAFHDHRPDYVMLLCLRADHERVAGTRTVSIREVLPMLGAETREALARPEFETAAPPSFGAGQAATEPHAVLMGAPEDPDLLIDFAATRPLTERAAAAIGALGEAFERVSVVANLAPGDLVIVDNRVTAHGRTSFTPRYDGRDRWLQRTFVAANLRRSRDRRPGDGYVIAS
ncbi:TauD/TfdA family dioxygenase [Actinoplanes sp. KI2]|uniref:TauD/TfdA family dioxygenase n=1 Tax=Actinoplanes sp. KI2 TaxID=2983315 RepID=UPI0021D57C00|nr:TauD/TfdA family dioxygenase [Actinoplanes sp. KI2]MCU7728832.1 TauD/TfdA family dioxygenase [Actinoplanes sp. KI2]